MRRPRRRPPQPWRHPSAKRGDGACRPSSKGSQGAKTDGTVARQFRIFGGHCKTAKRARCETCACLCNLTRGPPTTLSSALFGGAGGRDTRRPSVTRYRFTATFLDIEFWQ
eukprot:scaffold61238_cov64-Phaeocystis_antarctica.AAC.4